jgi:serine/threonine protein phosphatase PrpC
MGSQLPEVPASDNLPRIESDAPADKILLARQQFLQQSRSTPTNVNHDLAAPVVQPDPNPVTPSGQPPAPAAVAEPDPNPMAPSELHAPPPTPTPNFDPSIPYLPAGRGPKWTHPAALDSGSVGEGLYQGRHQVGDVGAMMRVLPSVRSKLAGAHVPDSIVDAGLISDSVSVGVVSIKGASHHLSATPRQDAYAIGSDESWVAIAIADGVSDGKLSHVAAAEAARVAVSETLRALVTSTPDKIAWSEVGGKTRDAVRDLGQRRAQQQFRAGDSVPAISDRTITKIMSTTCDLLVLPVARAGGSLRVWRIRISGDSSFYVLDPTRGWGLLDSGKDITSSTIDNSVGDALPLGGEQPDVESWDLAPGQALVLCTDGFGDVIGAGALPVGRYLFEAWQRPLDTVQLLSTSSFLNTNADDDRTAAIVWATS